MNKKIKVFIFIAIIFITGIPLWLTSYTQYLNNKGLIVYPLLISLVCAGILAYKTNFKKRKILLYVIAAQQVSFLIKVAIDCTHDSTNHSLLPFEMILQIIVDGVLCTIAAFVGSYLRQYI
jgi:hypothetical protein